MHTCVPLSGAGAFSGQVRAKALTKGWTRVKKPASRTEDRQGHRLESGLMLPIVRQAKLGKEGDDVDIEILSAAQRVRAPHREG